MSRNAEVVTRPERRYRFVIDIASLRGLGIDSRRHGRGQRRHGGGPCRKNLRCGIHLAPKELQLSALLVAITRPEVCGADSARRDADEDHPWFERDAVLGGFDVYMLRLHGKPLRMNHPYALCVPAVKDVRSLTRSPAPLPVSSAARGVAVSYFGVAVRSSNWMIESALVHTPNLPDIARLSNVRYIVQRLAAIGLLLFLGAHLWLAWAQPRFFQGRPEPFADIAHEMRHTWATTLVYVLGVLAIAYHLANGLWSFAMGWGITVSKRGLAWAERIAFVVFMALLTVGWSAVYALWRAGA